MPKFDGVTVVQEFRRLSASPEPKFVLVTAYPVGVANKLSEKLGVEVFSKPLEAEQLSYLINGSNT